MKNPYIHTNWNVMSVVSQALSWPHHFRDHMSEVYQDIIPQFISMLEKDKRNLEPLFWVITLRVVVISHRRFGKNNRSHLQGSRIIYFAAVA